MWADDQSLPAGPSLRQRSRAIRPRTPGLGQDVCDELDGRWVEQGETFLLQLRAAVHRDIEPAQINPLEPEIRSWQAHGRDLERHAVAAGAPPIRDWLTSCGR
jgi:hypothetical protein